MLRFIKRDSIVLSCARKLYMHINRILGYGHAHIDYVSSRVCSVDVDDSLRFSFMLEDDSRIRFSSFKNDVPVDLFYCSAELFSTDLLDKLFNNARFS